MLARGLPNRLPNVQGAVSFGDLAAPQRYDPGERPVCDVGPGDAGERALGTAHHLAGFDVVLGAMPRAYEAAVVVDGAAGEVGAQCRQRRLTAKRFPAALPTA